MEMVNIKKPLYALKLGHGLFRAFDEDNVWMCSDCNKDVYWEHGTPPSRYDGGCPANPDGKHRWERL
jgi:hypothetical protein